MDVVIQLPTDWAILDGRDSMDDHGVVRYEWALVKGDPSVSMKVQTGFLSLTYHTVAVAGCEGFGKWDFHTLKSITLLNERGQRR